MPRLSHGIPKGSSIAQPWVWLRNRPLQIFLDKLIPKGLQPSGFKKTITTDSLGLVPHCFTRSDESIATQTCWQGDEANHELFHDPSSPRGGDFRGEKNGNEISCGVVRIHCHARSANHGSMGPG